MIDSVLSAGLQGVQNGIANAREAARDIVEATTTTPGTIFGTTDNPGTTENTEATASIIEAVVDLKASELQVAASAAVIKTADEVLGTLVDTRA